MALWWTHGEERSCQLSVVGCERGRGAKKQLLYRGAEGAIGARALTERGAKTGLAGLPVGFCVSRKLGFLLFCSHQFARAVGQTPEAEADAAACLVQAVLTS